MSKEQKQSFQSSEEFYCYMAIYSAYVDFQFSPEEKNVIQAEFGTDNFTKMHTLFLAQSEFGSLQLILKNKDQYIKNDKDKGLILSRLSSLFSIDGDYSKLEKIQLQFFEKLL